MIQDEHMELRKLYLDLAKRHDEQRKQRREIEWKLAFGFWTAIAVFPMFCISQSPSGGGMTAPLVGKICDIYLGDYSLAALAVLYLLLAAVAVRFWMYPLQRAHSQDGHWLRYYLEKVERPLCYFKAPDEYHSFRTFKPNTRDWFLGQVFFTVLLLAVSWLIIASAVPNPANVPAPAANDKGQ